MKKLLVSLSALLMLIFIGCGGEGSPVESCTPNTIIGTYDTNDVAQDISMDDNLSISAQGSAPIAVFDISDRSTPVLLEEIFFGRSSSAKLNDNHIYALVDVYQPVGDPAYDFRYFLHIIDISDISSPDFITSILFKPILTPRSNWIEFDGNYIHLVGLIEGLTENYHIYDISDKSNPVRVSSMAIDGTCSGDDNILYEIKLNDNVAYIGSSVGVHAVDFTDRSNPVLLKELNSGCSGKSFDINGDILYSASGDLLETYNIANPANMYKINYIMESTKYQQISVINNTAYTLGLNGEISIVDVSDPNAIVDTDEDIYVDYYSYRIVDDERYVYVADGAGLKIIDTCNGL